MHTLHQGRFKAIHHLQSCEKLRFLRPSLILRHYNGYRFNQTMSECIAIFQRIKVLRYLKGLNCFSIPKVQGLLPVHVYEICLNMGDFKNNVSISLINDYRLSKADL